MLFKNESKCIFRGVKSLVSSKTNKPFSLVTVADTSTYETWEFFPEDVNEWNALKENQEVKIALKSNGNFTSVVLQK